MSDRDHFASRGFQDALEEYEQLEQAHREGAGAQPPDVNDFLAARGQAPPSGHRLAHEDQIICPPGYRPVPVGDQSGNRGGPPFCTCEPI